MIKAPWTENDLKQSVYQKEGLAEDVIATESIEYEGGELQYDVVKHTADYLRNVFVPNNRMAAYPAASYMWMTDAIDKKYRPLIAMIEAYDVPRMKMMEQGCAIKAIDNAIHSHYALSDLSTKDIYVFLLHLKEMYDYFLSLYSAENDEMEHKFSEMSSAVKRMDALIDEYKVRLQ